MQKLWPGPLRHVSAGRRADLHPWVGRGGSRSNAGVGQVPLQPRSLQSARSNGCMFENLLEGTSAAGKLTCAVSETERERDLFSRLAESPITNGGPMRPGGFARLLCPAEEEERERESERPRQSCSTWPHRVVCRYKTLRRGNVHTQGRWGPWARWKKSAPVGSGGRPSVVRAFACSSSQAQAVLLPESFVACAVGQLCAVHVAISLL